MSNLAIFARACLLSGAAIGCSFHSLAVEAAAAEFKPIRAEQIAETFDYLTFNPVLTISSISGDGSTIGGSITDTGVEYDCASFDCGTSAFVWSLKEEKHRPLSPILIDNAVWNASPIRVSALSNDGQSALVVSQYRHFESAIHREGSTKLLRDSVIFGQWLQGTDMSSDGSAIVGSLGDEPFRWTESSGLQSLSGIASGSGYGSTAISGDGQVVLLNDGVTSFNSFTPLVIFRNALRWTESTGTHELLPLSGANYSHAAKTSFDGSVTVGSSRKIISGRVEFDRLVLGSELLTQATAWIEGSPVLLESPISFDSTNALDVSADGLHIVGSASNDSNATDVFRFPQAILWRDGEALVLQDLLMEQYGLANELAGWHLTTATAISDDGTVIAGQGIDPDGFSAAWVATLVIPEPASLMLLCLAISMGVPHRGETSGVEDPPKERRHRLAVQ